jgi:hypothetical protein
MTGLYQNEKIKGMINIAHGEGFGLPMFEAAREGFQLQQLDGLDSLIFFIMMEKIILTKSIIQCSQFRQQAVGLVF